MGKLKLELQPLLINVAIMNLEDHLGDVIRKARAMSGVSPEAAARAARLTVNELAALEESGNVTTRANFAELALLLGLHGGKLESLAKGWLPAKVDLNRWRELRQFSTTRRGNLVHCYLVWDAVTREAALFDTGWDPQSVLDLIAEKQLQLQRLFLTHTHEDHIAGMAAIRENHPTVRLHSGSKHAPREQRIGPTDLIHLGSLRIANRNTPGHAEDGVTYIIGAWPDDAPQVAIVGDAIFAGSMGGAPQHGALAKQKVRDQILTLPSDTLICPGHGPLTTVAEEKANNPFF
jgi:glyoxylase-like metal-dependent hydrolase (beta-lactamase superfamily II)